MAVTFELNSLLNTSIPKGAGNTVDAHYKKTDLKVFVVVKAAPIHLLV